MIFRRAKNRTTLDEILPRDWAAGAKRRSRVHIAMHNIACLCAAPVPKRSAPRSERAPVTEHRPRVLDDFAQRFADQKLHDEVRRTVGKADQSRSLPRVRVAYARHRLRLLNKALGEWFFGCHVAAQDFQREMAIQERGRTS